MGIVAMIFAECCNNNSFLFLPLIFLVSAVFSFWFLNQKEICGNRILSLFFFFTKKQNQNNSFRAKKSCRSHAYLGEMAFCGESLQVGCFCRKISCLAVRTRDLNGITLRFQRVQTNGQSSRTHRETKCYVMYSPALAVSGKQMPVNGKKIKLCFCHQEKRP